MLFLLRNIRRKLLTNNKVMTYLLYAIGEIFLVVVGILIAVSIDNWNEDRQQKNIQNKYLQNLMDDLEADIVGMETYRVNAHLNVLASRNIRERSNKDSIGSLYDFSKTLNQLIFVVTFTPNQSTIQEMVSTGNFSNLQNDSLKLSLSKLYRSYEFMESGQEHIRHDYDLFLTTFQKHLDWGDFYDMTKTKTIDNMVFDSLRIVENKEILTQNAKMLLRDKVFMNNIHLMDINYGFFVPFYDKKILEVKEVIHMISHEINK